MLNSEAGVISCFAQDSQGLIWIGSNKGLFSYDGYSTRQHFTFENPENTRINCILTVQNKYLYLGSDNGIHIYNFRTDRYEYPDTTFPPDVRAMVIRNNQLWIGTLNGLYIYHMDNAELIRVSKETIPGLPHETIYAILHTQSDDIYIGTYNGFCKYNPQHHQFETITLPASTTKSNLFINSLLEDAARNCIWVGSEGNLYQYFPSGNTSRTIEVMNDNSIKSLVLDQNNQLLAGTDNGLFIYNDQEPVQHILHDSRNTQSLSNNIIWCIFKDQEKNIWLGTDYGISLARYNNSFQYIPISQITGTGEGNHFYTLYRDTEDTFWFGGTNGLIKFDSLENPLPTWFKMGDKAHVLNHNRIRHIFEDSNKDLWISTDGSINRYDRKNNRFTHFTIVDSTHTYNANWAYHMLEDKGNLWIATCLGGLFVVNKENLIKSGNSTYVADYNLTTQTGLSGMFINQLVTDCNGDIWVFYYNNGIDKIDPETYRVTQVDLETMIPNKNLSYLIADNQGMIWAGFRGGILFISPHENSYEVINLNQFGDNEVLSLTEVDDNIWITTTDGVWILQKETRQAKRINLTNATFSSIYYDKADRKIYMGAVDGFAVVSPDIVEEGSNGQPILITSVLINNNPLFPGDKAITEGNSIRYSHKITLKHNQNNLRLSISDLSYMREEKTRFVYWLDDVDPDWMILPSGSNQITYNNLKYGKYKLLVSKLDENGNPSQSIQTIIPIDIKAPWYYTGWAKLMYSLLIISLVIWIVNFFRVKNNLRIERIEKEKIAEQSKLKIDFFTNMSHELKTPLSMIIAPVSKLLIEVKNQKEKQQLELVQRNAMRLNSLIHQTLDLNRMDNNASSALILSKVEFVSFAKGILSIYKEGIGKQKNIQYCFYTNIDKLYMEADLIKFESILNNLLVNAWKYTAEGGSVSLSLNYNVDDKLLQVTVQDNGSGIPAKDIPYIFQRFFQSPKTFGKKEGTGIGLYLVKTYTELHRGRIEVASEEEKGTTFTITLPVFTESGNERPAEDAINDSDKPLILLVEDNREIAEFIGELLSPLYRIKIAENGKAGLHLATELVPDLIIADFMMPVMNGLDMGKQLKKNLSTSTIPVILLTAKNDKETELESMRIKIDAFIPKPFEPDILVSRIQQLLISKQQMETKARMDLIATPKAIDAVSQDEKLLFNITTIIENKVADPDLNVNALSDLSGMNTKQLYRKIKQLTGMTPVEYIKSIRMKKAAMLFEQKKFTVAEVMYMVGYSNHSYFSKCFQAEIGKTPKQYMEEC